MGATAVSHDVLVTSHTSEGPPRLRRGAPWTRRVSMVAASLALLATAVWLVGSQALLQGFVALTPATVAAALAFGLITTVAQSLRWRTLACHRGITIDFRRALADCYASSFGNMVLPGGLGGDAARVAVHRDGGHRRWLSPLLALSAERLSATTLLFAVAAVTLVAKSTSLAAIAAGVALSCMIVTAWCMRGLGPARSLLVWGTSAVGVTSLLVLFLIGMAALEGPVVPALAVVGLASMSVPLGVGGWGVRELSLVVLAPTLAVDGDHAVATATAYGLLATISSLPGLVVVLLSWWRRGTSTPNRTSRLSPCMRSAAPPYRNHGASRCARSTMTTAPGCTASWCTSFVCSHRC